MTDTQPAQFDWATELSDAQGHVTLSKQEAKEIGARLRRLHAYCQELESQVILDCMTHVQNPAEIEHVAGVVSKNGAELNMTGSAMRASHGQAPAQAAPAAVAGTHVTDAMALAFHSALSDGAIGSDEVEETKAGLRAALAASPTTVNRYCRAGMCVPSDTKHEPWCTAHRDREIEIESLRARSVAPAGEYPALPDDTQAAPQTSPAAQGDALSDLRARCVEVLAWRETGTLPGEALRTLAREKYGDRYDAIQRAERDTETEAMNLVAAQEGKSHE